MVDQAQTLRTLMAKRRQADSSSIDGDSGSTATAIGLTSGKGGVGKTTLALNLAIAMQTLPSNKRVCLWDVAGNAALDLLCKCSGSSGLESVLDGQRQLEDVIVDGPAGLKLIAGAGASIFGNSSSCEIAKRRSVLAQIKRQFDILILDIPPALDGETQNILNFCDLSLLITTPDPTSVTAAYSILKSCPGANWSLLVNQTENSEEAVRVIDRFRETGRMFLQQTIDTVGFIPHDTQFVRSSLAGVPLSLSDPDATGSAAVRGLASRLVDSRLALPTDIFPNQFQLQECA